jgi:putative nucleotidyltransferase with HDIG domain
VYFNEELTGSALTRSIDNISDSRGMVSKGEPVILKGETVSPEKFQMLESIRKEYESKMGSFRINSVWVVAGQFIIVTALLAMLLLFLVLLRKDIFEDSIQLSFLFSLIVAEVIVSSFMVNLSLVSIYLFPFCIMPIIIRAFFDTRLALFAHMLTMLIIGFLVPNPFEFFVIQMIGGIACIFSIVSMRKRSQLFITITLLTISYLICYSGITLMVEGQISSLELIDMGWLAGSAALTLFSYPIIYFIEKVFGFTSDVSLLELSDTNNPLMKELALKAPGTFQHSLQVANLAEAAIYRIGGNTLLTRTGALYHDIGKMELARYFIENQMTGVNPHDELGFDESASIIISHVKHGIRLGRKYGLPENIMDFIRTHHGNSRVQYFYRSFLKNFPDAEVDEGAFRYPGPIPFSRETAVVMMADSVEATSRSLKVVNGESIDQMVENIINQQIADNQFINSDITFKDITAIKKIFKKMLMNIYHVRVEYPK